MFNSEATKKFFSSMAKTDGISVEYDERTMEPRSYKGNKVILPTPNELTSEVWEGMAHKEVSFLYKENQWLLESPATDKDQQDPVYNTAKRIIGDHIAERNRYGEYEGRDQALSRNRGRITKELQESQPQLTDSGVKLDEKGEVIKSLLEWDLRTRKEFMEYDVKIQPDYAEGSLTCPGFDSMMEDIMKLENQEDMDQLLQDLLQFEPPPEEPDGGEGDDSDESGDEPGEDDNGDGNEGQGEENQEEQEEESEGEDEQEGDDGDGDGDPDDSSGDSSPDSDGDGVDDERDSEDSEPGDEDEQDGEDGEGSNGEGNTEPGDAEGQAGGSPDGEDQDGDGEERPGDTGGPGQGNDGSPHDSTIVDDHHGTGSGTTADSGVIKELPEVPLDLSEVATQFKDTEVKRNSHEMLEAEREFERKHQIDRATEYIPLAQSNLITGKELDDHPYYHGTYFCSKVAVSEYHQSSTISRQIKRYLQAISQESWLYGQRRGKLSNRSISRIYGGQRQPRIYKKRQSTMLNNDTAISLLMDCSGSMMNTKYNIAAACCLCLSETLSAVGIVHEILGFTEDNYTEHYEFKNFGENIASTKLLNRLTSNAVDPGCNADGESLAFAAERLLRRPEKSKVMIVFSDGQPAGSYSGDGSAYLMKICKKIEEETPVKLHGIGICSGAVRKYYKSCEVINDPQQLDRALMTLLKSQVLK